MDTLPNFSQIDYLGSLRSLTPANSDKFVLTVTLNMPQYISYMGSSKSFDLNSQGGKNTIINLKINISSSETADSIKESLPVMKHQDKFELTPSNEKEDTVTVNIISSDGIQLYYTQEYSYWGPPTPLVNVPLK